MRLWSLHPRYLDPQGLVALWRKGCWPAPYLLERLAAIEIIRSLSAFALCLRSAINFYLQGVHAEALARGYSFDRSKIGRARSQEPVLVNFGSTPRPLTGLVRFSGPLMRSGS